ncbi:hypothetical protein CCAL9344_03735 [Campylobacter sp. RM9344]|uniref:DUF4066 domain protein n=1 Tax=Campylobacter californiensis TaxID=1032243 RepID=A0AAW3ZV91_9BACT|nr:MULTISPECIES: hypothetical protein [unclassified Campylobacter]MBE2984864.1 hypothetical protein [Campylobacter sp. RM6883]MBE2986297.1 hypothetical protein [Campylobacter sp. RM12919]MBE2988072.1 hypothetical protein [Campylobacter sp. RM12920]MBE2995360.1 hypothetical protein [Campylobacter sp. RM6913]MBE3022445.1 hypothetical protein [Campylobacter sp. 7477a]MBE3029305.1 hypothetical protein [Campylobacter sp. RM9344]
MKVGILLYDKVNLLNFAQIHSFLRTFEKISVKTYAFKAEIIDESGIRLHPEIYGESLYGIDMMVVPDGIGALSLRYDEIFLSWVRSGSSARIKMCFDLGALVFGGAGFLIGKEACIRGGYKNALSEYCMVNEAKLCDVDGVISASEWGEETRSRLVEILG